MKAMHTLPRRLLPLAALALSALACNEAATEPPTPTPPATAAPLAAEPAQLGADPVPLSPTEPTEGAAAPGPDPEAVMAAVELASPGRTIVRASIGCQEWNPGSPPKDIECPDELENGEVIRFLTSSTCARSGVVGREAKLPCPEVKPIAK